MRGKGMGTVARVQVNLYVSERQRPNGLTLLCEVEHKGDNFVGFYRGSVVQYAFNVALQRLWNANNHQFMFRVRFVTRLSMHASVQSSDFCAEWIKITLMTSWSCLGNLGNWAWRSWMYVVQANITAYMCMFLGHPFEFTYIQQDRYRLRECCTKICAISIYVECIPLLNPHSPWHRRLYTLAQRAQTILAIYASKIESIPYLVVMSRLLRTLVNCLPEWRRHERILHLITLTIIFNS